MASNDLSVSTSIRTHWAGWFPHPPVGVITLKGWDALTQNRDSFSGSGRTLGKFGETMPGDKAFAKLLATERSAQQMSLEREVLPDRVEARSSAQRHRTDPLHFFPGSPYLVVARAASN
jgi:hypothetical protein